MTGNQYHIASNGTYAECNAHVQACPRGGHVLFTREEILEGAASGDARFIAPPKVGITYAREAEEGMKEAQKNYADARKVQKAVDEKMDEWKKQNPFDWRGRPFGVEAVGRSHDAALKRLRAIIVGQGIAVAKAGFIISDMKTSGPDAYVVPVKKRDKYDPDIEAKTTRARELAANDPEVKSAKDHAEVWAERQKWNEKHSAAYLAAKNEAVAALGGNGMSVGPAQAQLQASMQELANRREWYFSGVHEKAEEVNSLTNVTPDQLTVNDRGEINNMWLAHTSGGPAERIVAYRQPEKLEGFAHGYFETESGKRIAHTVRYANYRRTETDPTQGDTRILVGPKVEDSHPYPTRGLSKNQSGEPYFHAYGEVDSGG